MSHHLDHMIREFFMVYTSCFATYNVLNNARWVLASVADPWKVSARSLQSCGLTVKRKLCQHRLTKQQQLYFLNIEDKKTFIWQVDVSSATVQRIGWFVEIIVFSDYFGIKIKWIKHRMALIISNITMRDIWVFPWILSLEWRLCPLPFFQYFALIKVF